MLIKINISTISICVAKDFNLNKIKIAIKFKNRLNLKLYMISLTNYSIAKKMLKFIIVYKLNKMLNKNSACFNFIIRKCNIIFVI